MPAFGCQPNIDHLLALHASEQGRMARFHPEARSAFLRFAQSEEAAWRGNFRDLSSSITRLATLAEGGRITQAQVEAETARLRWLWARQEPESGSESGPESNPRKCASGRRLVYINSVFCLSQCSAITNVITFLYQKQSNSY